MRQTMKLYFVDNRKTTHLGIVAIILGMLQVVDSWDERNLIHITTGVTAICNGLSNVFSAEARPQVQASQVEPTDKVMVERPE